MCVSSSLISEIKRIIKTSEIMKEDDKKWPEKNKDGRQELEIRIGGEHISFEASLLGYSYVYGMLMLACRRQRSAPWSMLRSRMILRA